MTVYDHLGGSETGSGSKEVPPLSTNSSVQSTTTSESSEEVAEEINTKKARKTSGGSGQSSSSSSKARKDEEGGAKKTTPRKRADDGGDDKKRSKKKKKSSSADDESDSNDGDEGGEEKSRFRWTDELHQYFLACVFELGLEIASPKKVFLKMMSDQNFAKTVLDEDMFNHLASPDAPKKFGAHHVKSHLQRFRSNIVPPREAFIKQLAELMQEAKRKKKEDGKMSKVLNPEYHAYPFSADRIFPDGMIHSEVANMVSSATALLKPTLGRAPVTAGMHHFPPPPPLFGAPGTAGSAGAASAIFARPRTLSSYEAGEQMRAQVEVREMIESRSQRQVIQVQQQQAANGAASNGNVEDFDVLQLPQQVAFQDEDNLFDWLIAPDFFPREDHQQGGAQSQNNTNTSNGDRN